MPELLPGRLLPISTSPYLVHFYLAFRVQFKYHFFEEASLIAWAKVAPPYFSIAAYTTII